MEYRRLGDSGLVVSAIGLGTNNFGERVDQHDVQAVVGRAIDLGVTFFDTADIYGHGASERLLGRALVARRHDVLIATKGGWPVDDSRYRGGASRRWLIAAAEASLRRLGTDYVDLYQLHRPDPATPLLETLQALDDLVRSGKVRYVGHSNLAAWQMVDAQWIARTEHLVRPVSAQLPFNLLRREVAHEALPACRAMGLGLIPYSPLADGFLTGKYRANLVPRDGRLSWSTAAREILTPANFGLLERLRGFAAARDHSLLELAIGWLLSHDGVATVITGAMTADQISENVHAGGWRLNATEMEELDLP